MRTQRPSDRYFWGRSLCCFVTLLHVGWEDQVFALIRDKGLEMADSLRDLFRAIGKTFCSSVLTCVRRFPRNLLCRFLFNAFVRTKPKHMSSMGPTLGTF